MRIAYPVPADVVAALAPFGVEADVTQSSEAALIVSVKTPKGTIELR